MIEFDLFIPQKIVLNSNQRLHHMDTHRRRSELRRLGSMMWESKRRRHGQLAKAEAKAVIYFRDSRRRDPNNWWPTVKALVDGMVSGPTGKDRDYKGVLPDDDSTHLIGPDMRGDVDKDLPVGVIRIRLYYTPMS